MTPSARSVISSILRPAKDAWWEVRGIGLRLPQPPASPRSLLFVCLGNICRSPFAGLLAGRMLRESGCGDVVCSSAGIRPSQGNRSPEAAIAAASAWGIDLSTHRPQALTAELVEGAGLVLAMDVSHLSHLRQYFPAQRSRIALLPLFEDRAGVRRRGYRRYNIPDPFGKPPAEYEACYGRIHGVLGDLLRSVGPWGP